MKTARKFAFALIMVMSFVMSPVLASANSGDQDPAAPCSTLEECQAMVARFEQSGAGTRTGSSSTAAEESKQSLNRSWKL